ncbi:MAG: peroxiredoxin family protein [Isosphaeraceae bacterium]|nr:peroxiredoxin family protein [Isosphaeraceae bacterium]
MHKRFVGVAGITLLGGLVLAATTWAAAPKVGDTAADFSLLDLEGRKHTLSEFTSKKPTVLVVLRGYPGYQCPACSAQVRSLIDASEDLRSANVVLVYPGPADQLTARAKEFVGSKSLPEGFTLLLDPAYRFTSDYGLRWNAPNETAYPSTFVIDGSNKVRFAKVSRSHGGRASAREVIGALGGINTPK